MNFQSEGEREESLRLGNVEVCWLNILNENNLPYGHCMFLVFLSIPLAAMT